MKKYTLFNFLTALISMTLLLACSSAEKPSEQTEEPFSFPGPVSSQVQRLEHVVKTIDMTVVDYSYMKTWFPPEPWRSTGLYAAPGEIITIDVPNDLNCNGLYIQIGSHVDTLEFIPKEERLREGNIVVKKLITPGENSIVNPLGGLIYFIPTNINEGSSIDVKISGAVEAAYYQKNITGIEEWNEMLKKDLPPFSELSGDKVIITVPTHYLHLIEDPHILMETLDDFVEKVNHLAGYTENPDPINAFMDKAPYDPWRYVADIQLSYGYMYCGYPIMFYSEDSIKNLLVVERFKNNGWGFWHELGHNYQQYNWETESLVEVTCNVYALFMQAYYQSTSRLEEDNDGNGKNSYEEAMAFLNLPDDQRNYHKDESISYFTRLVFFDELIRDYGYEIFPEIAKTFRRLDPKYELVNDYDKMSFFCQVLSDITGKDEYGRFKKWGLIH